MAGEYRWLNPTEGIYSLNMEGAIASLVILDEGAANLEIYMFDDLMPKFVKTSYRDQGFGSNSFYVDGTPSGYRAFLEMEPAISRAQGINNPSDLVQLYSLIDTTRETAERKRQGSLLTRILMNPLRAAESSLKNAMRMWG